MKREAQRDKWVFFDGPVKQKTISDKEVVLMNDVTKRFLGLKAQIDDEINKLTSASDNHFGVDPERITWANVGDLNHLLKLLKEASSFMRL